jgi:RNA polymerase sigma factor (sigma-70 family)
MQDKAVKERERGPEKARAARTQVITFSDLGESVERVHHTLERHGDGSWMHYPERIVAPSPEEVTLKEERYAALREALEGLDPEDRELITQRYGYEGPPRTMAELAQARGCTREAVRLRIEKTLKMLRRKLQRP